MNKDKRVLKNEKNILNLKKYLEYILDNIEDFDLNKLKEEFKSQGSLSKISNKEFNIVKSSINTLKRNSDAVLLGGFNELDELRLKILNKKEKNKSVKNIRNKKYLEEKVKDLENKNDHLMKSNLIVINMLNKDLLLLKKLKEETKDSIQKSMIEDAIKRLQYFIIEDSNNEVIKLEIVK